MIWGSITGFLSYLAPFALTKLLYLRRRSPDPPFPPDSRQAGERRGLRSANSLRCAQRVHLGVVEQAAVERGADLYLGQVHADEHELLPC